MTILARDTAPGAKYRPTRPGSMFDLRGRGWFTRAAPGWERKLVNRITLRRDSLSGREVWFAAMLDQGGTALRRHWKLPGEARRSEWVVVPASTKLRRVNR